VLTNIRRKQRRADNMEKTICRDVKDFKTKNPGTQVEKFKNDQGMKRKAEYDDKITNWRLVLQ